MFSFFVNHINHMLKKVVCPYIYFSMWLNLRILKSKYGIHDQDKRADKGRLAGSGKEAGKGERLLWELSGKGKKNQ